MQLNKTCLPNWNLPSHRQQSMASDNSLDQLAPKILSLDMLVLLSTTTKPSTLPLPICNMNHHVNIDVTECQIYYHLSMNDATYLNQCIQNYWTIPLTP